MYSSKSMLNLMIIKKKEIINVRREMKQVNFGKK